MTNILRVRDGVPTYYSDISHLRGSLREQLGLGAAAGVGHSPNWTGRSLINPSGAVEANPSFDVAPLNTQEFTRGINEPLDVRVFQYYLDRAIPPYTLMQLFIDKIEDVDYTQAGAKITVLTNDPFGEAVNACGPDSVKAGEHAFDDKLMDWLRPGLRLNAYRLLLPYGPAFALGADRPAGLRDYSYATRASNLTLRPVDGDPSTGDGGKSYRFYSVSNNVAFCVGNEDVGSGGERPFKITVQGQDGPPSEPRGYKVIHIARNSVGSDAATQSEDVDASACVKREVYSNYETPSKNADTYTILHFRSVDGMIEFLGRMLRAPPELRPLPFDISTEDAGTPRFTVKYEGKAYYVHDRHRRLGDARTQRCLQTETADGCGDSTLEILTLVNQLLNLNKKTSELPSTGEVQLVN